MTRAAGGTGAAGDATVITVDNTPTALAAALDAAREKVRRAFYYDQVDRLEGKLAKYEAHVEDTKAALETAEAELAAAKEQWAKEAAGVAAEAEETDGLGE